MLNVTCSHCRTRIQLKDAYAGRRIRCVACEGVLTVPSLPAAGRPTRTAVAAGRTDPYRTPPPPTRSPAPRYAGPRHAAPPARRPDRKTQRDVAIAALVLLLLLGLVGCLIELFNQATPAAPPRTAPPTV